MLKAQASFFVIAGIAALLLVSIFLGTQQSIHDSAERVERAEQHATFLSEQRAQWQEREALRVAVLDAIVEVNLVDAKDYDAQEQLQKPVSNVASKNFKALGYSSAVSVHILDKRIVAITENATVSVGFPSAALFDAVAQAQQGAESITANGATFGATQQDSVLVLTSDDWIWRGQNLEYHTLT